MIPWASLLLLLLALLFTVANAAGKLPLWPAVLLLIVLLLLTGRPQLLP